MQSGDLRDHMSATADRSAPPWDRTLLLSRPFFRALALVIVMLPETRFPTLEELNALALARGVVSGGGAPLRFVPALPVKDAVKTCYESRIHRYGEVPTRVDHWHDLFNALVWLAFPHAKAMLNAQHHRQIESGAAARHPGRRGTARDVLTLFDEGGVIVASAEAALAALLRGFEWRPLFVEHRDMVQARMRFHVFGHAIHEKALAPFRGITAKALVLDVDDAFLELPLEAAVAALDARAAAHFARAEALLSTRTLAPLPVLGIPEWTAANADPRYYDDVEHFRPGRTARGRGAP
jgi:hypothetical protein